MPELSEYNQVLLALDSIIRESLLEYDNESRFPNGDPYKMDTTLKFLKERVQTIRDLREAFEDVMGKVRP